MNVPYDEEIVRELMGDDCPIQVENRAIQEGWDLQCFANEYAAQGYEVV
jgi:hypothetical protein